MYDARCAATISNSHQCRNRARPGDAYCGTCRNAITRRLAKDNEYQLDANDHHSSCVLRFDEHEHCENDSGCVDDLPDESGALFHECASPEHINPPEHEDT